MITYCISCAISLNDSNILYPIYQIYILTIQINGNNANFPIYLYRASLLFLCFLLLSCSLTHLSRCLISLTLCVASFYFIRMMIRSTQGRVRLNCWSHSSNEAAAPTGWDFYSFILSSFPSFSQLVDWNRVHATLTKRDLKCIICIAAVLTDVFELGSNLLLSCQHCRSSHTGRMKCATESI